MNLILCGMMGAGKTTVGIKIAEKSNRRWYDTDEVITKRYGDISSIFAREGEAYFRGLETETVQELSKQDGLVISVGGGLVLKEENVSLLKRKGKIFLLRATKQTLLARLQGDRNRPLLQGEERLEDRLESLLSTRGPIYEKVADFIVDVDGKTVAEIAEEILAIALKNS
ncbi:MAG: shikimate kinase [Clostridia bacterium]|nr:shikimate kinase [Clostridia bacterium]